MPLAQRELAVLPLAVQEVQAAIHTLMVLPLVHHPLAQKVVPLVLEIPVVLVARLLAALELQKIQAVQAVIHQPTLAAVVVVVQPDQTVTVAQVVPVLQRLVVVVVTVKQLRTMAQGRLGSPAAQAVTVKAQGGAAAQVQADPQDQTVAARVVQALL